MINHACEYCGKIKQYKSPSLIKRFCSHKCANQWKWKHVRKKAEQTTLICPYCKKTFQISTSEYKVRTKKPHELYCSRECWKKSVEKHEKICSGCNKPFIPKDKRNTFCSKKCYQEYAKTTGIRKRTGFWMENGYKVLYNNGNSRKEHILVMEKYLGRKLNKGEVVHHIDGNKTNNDINNLKLMTAKEHSKMHREKEIKAGKNLFGR